MELEGAEIQKEKVSNLEVSPKKEHVEEDNQGINLSNQFKKDFSEIKTQIKGIHKEIQSPVIPKFLDISPKLKDVIELSIEVWKMENRVQKLLIDSEEGQKEFFENSFNKIKRYLGKQDIEILGHNLQKFNEGLNVEVLSVESSQEIDETIIKETVEPTVLHKGQVVRKGKVIVLEKELHKDKEIKDGE